MKANLKEIEYALDDLRDTIRECPVAEMRAAARSGNMEYLRELVQSHIDGARVILAAIDGRKIDWWKENMVAAIETRKGG